jgi:2-polyprenyl-3-methyl-5-hydroxy-6-metoxy-1,4-benzoquinol methylase
VIRVKTIQRLFNKVGLDIRRYQPTNFDPGRYSTPTASGERVEIRRFGWGTGAELLDYLTRKVYSRWDYDAANYDCPLELVEAHQWGLKGLGYCRVVEAARALHREGAPALRVLDVGGGGSALTRVLHETIGAQCWLIDDFGVASGDADTMSWYTPGFGDVLAAKNPMVSYDSGRLGSNSVPQLANQTFDLIYSVSTLEHVPLQDLPGVFDHMFRLLAPDGAMVHTIDLNPNAFPAWQNFLAEYFVRHGVDPRVFAIRNCDEPTDRQPVLIESPEIQFALQGQQCYIHQATLMLEIRRTSSASRG